MAFPCSSAMAMAIAFRVRQVSVVRSPRGMSPGSASKERISGVGGGGSTSFEEVRSSGPQATATRATSNNPAWRVKREPNMCCIPSLKTPIRGGSVGRNGPRWGNPRPRQRLKLSPWFADEHKGFRLRVGTTAGGEGASSSPGILLPWKIQPQLRKVVFAGEGGGCARTSRRPEVQVLVNEQRPCFASFLDAALPGSAGRPGRRTTGFWQAGCNPAGARAAGRYPPPGAAGRPLRRRPRVTARAGPAAAGTGTSDRRRSARNRCPHFRNGSGGPPSRRGSRFRSWRSSRTGSRTTR